MPESFSRWRILRFWARQSIEWWIQGALRRPLAWAMVQGGVLLRLLGSRRHGLKLLLSGRRLSVVPKADAAIRRIISQDEHIGRDLVELFGESADRPLSACAGRVLILKVPRLDRGEVVEKGALVVKFTETFAPLFKGLDVQRLANYFRIILEPSWVGYSLPEILAWTKLAPEKVIVMAPYQPDFDLLQSLDSNLVPTGLGPADWVNPTRFQKVEGTQTTYDAIYVANYNPKKRVDRYLRAVVRVSRIRPGYRAALICAGVGRNRHGRAIQESVAWAKGKADLEFFHAVPQDRLNELFNQSKVNVLLSLREGMNKGLAEGLFAGTPALLLAESACGNHRHINSETGRVVPDGELEEALHWFADHHEQFRPHEWAKRNLSPHVGAQRLSSVLRDIEFSEGRAWTTDLLVKANQPEMKYLDPGKDWLLDAGAKLLDAFVPGRLDSNVSEFIGMLDSRFHEPLNQRSN